MMTETVNKYKYLTMRSQTLKKIIIPIKNPLKYYFKSNPQLQVQGYKNFHLLPTWQRNFPNDLNFIVFFQEFKESHWKDFQIEL